MEKNLTTGSVFKNIVFFSLPYLLSYFLQTLYGLADLFIIGQFNGVSSTTAVSIGSQIMHMITVMIVGLAMGTTVKIAHAVGSKNRREMNLAVGNTAILFISLSFVVAAILLAVSGKIVALMSTPAEAVTETQQYLIICFIGIPFITAYNVISSVFRGMGDSKSPMYFIAVACAANIVLDYLFIGALDMKSIGAALGTTVSQAISVVIALTVIIKKKMIPGLSRSDFKLNKVMMKTILKVGIPVSAQDGFIQISFILITIFANLRGINDAAAVGIVEKMISFFFLVPSSMLSAVSALAAQNIGAGKHDRASLTLKYAAMIAISFGIVIAAAMQFAAGAVVGLFTDEAEVVRLGDQYMRSYIWDCIFAGIHFTFSGYFCAYGKSWISFLHNVLSMLLIRVPLSWYMAKTFLTTLYPMGLAAPAGSLLSIIICITAFILMQKNLKKNNLLTVKNNM